METDLILATTDVGTGGTWAAAVLAMMTGVATFFAQRAARMAKQTRQAQEVKTVHNGTVDMGQAVTHLEVQLNQVIDAMTEFKAALRDNSMKVEGLETRQARHEGQHEGLSRDIDRLIRRVYGNGISSD